MSNNTSPDHVDQLIADYLTAERSGTAVDRPAFVAAHPESAAELTTFFADRDQFSTMVDPLRKVIGSGDGEGEVVPGQLWGEYELLHEIARGGMGVVYKARHARLNRLVALKMVLADRGSEVDLERFHAEARAVANLEHPHIVPIYEVSERDGRPYFSMQYIAGGSLRGHIERFRGKPREAARLVATVARAVHHAHQRGIIHRDLKPGNILLDEQGQPHVTDFGLAKRLKDDSRLTQEGAVVGTPSYMAPEQAEGKADLTTAADVYGIGAVFHELLTGRPPFEGKSALDTLMRVVSDEVPAPQGLDRDLTTICLKCLEKDRSRRYASAADLADDLERWLDGQPIQARPVQMTERLSKWSRRNPLAAGLSGIAVMLTLGLLVVAGLTWRNAELRAQAVTDLGKARQEAKDATTLADEQRKLADEQRQLAEKQKALATRIEKEVRGLEKSAIEARMQLEAARLEARRTLYAADLQMAHVAWQAGNVSLTNELLARYREAAGADLRGFEWDYLWKQTHAARRSWRADVPTSPSFFPVHGLAISPDAQTLATATPASGQGGNKVRLWNLADGKLLHTLEGKTHIVNLFFPGDGKRVFATVRKPLNYGMLDRWFMGVIGKKEPFTARQLEQSLEFHSWEGGENKSRRVEPFDPSRLEGTAFTAFAGLCFAAHEDKALGVVSLTRSPDGKYLALGGMQVALPGDKTGRGGEIRGGFVLVYDLGKGQVVSSRFGSDMVASVGFVHGAKYLAIGHSSGVIDLYEPDLGKQVRRFNGHKGFVYSLQGSPDGQQLLSGARDGQILLWDVASGNLLARFRGHTTGVMRVAMAPDGQSIVSAGMDGEIKVWESQAKAEVLVLSGHEKTITALSFSGDGRELVSADQSGAARAWRMPDGKLLRELPPTKGESILLGISRDGKLLASNSTAQKGTILVRDVASGKERKLLWKDRNPWSAAFSADGRLVAVGNLSGQASIWNLADGKLLATLEQGKYMPGGMTFTMDGKTLAVIIRGDKGSTVQLWDWEQGRQRKVFEDPGTMTALALSPDETRLAVAIMGNTVRIIDLRQYRQVCECHGAGLRVSHLAFSPDGRRLVSAGETPAEQGLVKLWDASNGREVFSAALPSVMVTALAMSPDGRGLAAALANSDGFSSMIGQGQAQIHVWDASVYSR